MENRERPIRIKEVSELTGFSCAYIYHLVHRKSIPYHKPTGGRLFFYESEILAFLARGRNAADYEVSDMADAILNGEAR